MQKTADQCCIIENAKQMQHKKLTAKDLMKGPKPMQKTVRKKTVSPWVGRTVAIAVLASTLLLFMK